MNEALARAMDGNTGIRDRLRDERGYTIVELLTGALLSLLLIGTFGWVIVTASGNQPEIADRSAQVDQGRVALEKITRDLRDAYVIHPNPTANQVSVNTFVRSASCGSTATLSSDQPSIACRVTFTCTTTYCTRTEANPDGTGTGPVVRIAQGMQSSSVFSYSPSSTNPTHVRVTLSFPGDDGDESITVSDGAELRNDS